ncbi:MAG: DUF177 domain-containing protein [Actinomycetaceae bacterium]|nr:DUF177 domain-containing protein [Actinomycetaceae bacterium]
MTSVPFNGASVSIADLPTQPGHTRTYHFDLIAGDDLATEAMRVNEGDIVPADITAQSMPDGVLLQVSAQVNCTGVCVRCLDPVTLSFPVEVKEMFFTPEVIARMRKEEGDEAVEDLPVLDSNTIELEPLLRDAIVTQFPFTPLCSPDCDGLCDVCGEKWQDLPEDHEHEVIDPRFAKLAGFFSEEKDE